MKQDIDIVDVIHNYHAYSKNPQIMIVLSRMPEWVYERSGYQLTAHDSGIYNFLYEQPGSTGTFGEAKFDIKMTDGSTLHCDGQVWSGRECPDPEPLISAGINTIEGLAKCHCYMGCGGVSKAKYDAWMAVNTPSHNYHKYDPTETLEWLDEMRRKFPDIDRPISKKRARKLRQRGVTVRCHPVTGRLGWSPSYERQKAVIIRKSAPDYKGEFHPDVIAASKV